MEPPIRTCPRCGVPAAAPTAYCQSCGAALARSASLRWGIGLLLGGFGLGVMGVLLGAAAAFERGLEGLLTCFGRPQGPSPAVVAHAMAAVLAFGYGAAIGYLGLVVCAGRAAAPGGSGDLRAIAIGSLVLAAVGWLGWLLVFAGVPVGAPRWPAEGGFAAPQATFLMLGVLACLASVLQAGAAGATLAGKGEAPRWLRRATGVKLGLYVALWLLLPLAVSGFGGGAAVGAPYLLFSAGAVALYYWLALRTGVLAAPARTGTG